MSSTIWKSTPSSFAKAGEAVNSLRIFESGQHAQPDLAAGMIELARDLFGVGLSIGTVAAVCQRASDALARPHAQLHD
jgi:hypothetical protein